MPSLGRTIKTLPDQTAEPWGEPMQDSVRAIRRALALRDRGLSYLDIAIVMEAYHGVTATDGTWRHRLRTHGAEPRPQGRVAARATRLRTE